jgi:hypothetical protein
MSDALPTQTYPLRPNIDPQIVAGMARTLGLRVVKIGAWTITLEGREDDLAAFADRLEQLRRLCR